MQAARNEMPAMPELKSKGAKTGTNVRHRSLVREREKELAAKMELLEKAGQAYRRACRRLLSKADLRTAAEIAARASFELQRENLRRGNKAENWDEARRAARKRIEREFSRTLPGYRSWQKLAREYRRERAKLVRAIEARLPEFELRVDLSVGPPDSADTQVFGPPFTVYDVRERDSSAIVDNRSFAVPGIGHLVNNLAYEQRDDGPIGTDFFGLNWLAYSTSRSTCGVNFTTQRAGRIRVRAELRCVHSRMSCALRDRFGFSEAELSIKVALIVVVVQPNRTVELRKTILEDGLTSFGADISHVLPELDTEGVYVIEATTKESYPVNAGVQILAGCEIDVLSEVDDMRAYADVLLWWRLEKLTIGVV